MRRIKLARNELAEQLALASKAATTEPEWPSVAPAPLIMAQHARKLTELLADLSELEIRAASKREEVRVATALCQEMLRKVDYATTMLYGPSSEKKNEFGIRPVLSKTKKAVVAVVPLEVSRLKWREYDSSVLEWQAIPGASYDIEWFADEYLVRKLGTAASGEAWFDLSIVLHEGPLWVRVRARKATKISSWSIPVFLEGYRAAA